MPALSARLLAPSRRSAARRAARARDWPAAVARYRLLVASGGATARDRVQLAHALKETGDLAAAAEAYRGAVDAFPLDADARRQHGLFLRLAGDPGEATDALARAVALAPRDAALRDELDSLGFTDAVLDERMIPALLGSAEVPAPGTPLLARLRSARHAGAAQRHARAGRWSAAAVHLRRAIATDPRRPDLPGRLGDVLTAGGDAAGAVDAYRRALLLRPRTPELFVALGRALAADGRRAAALRAILAAWRLQPGHAAAHTALAEAGWTPAALSRLTDRTWALAEAGAPYGLDRRERAVWAHLARAVGAD